MNRTIKVVGKAKLSVKPDITRIVINLEGKAKEYAEVIELSKNMVEKLKAVVESQGFDKKDLKTVHFSINPDYENYKDEDECWKDRLVGYKYMHNLKLEFGSDNVRLGKLLYAVANFEGKPEFGIEYTASDSEAAVNELLKKAIKDAKAKAVVMAEAAGVELMEIVSVDYSFDEKDLTVRPMNAMLKMESACSLRGDVMSYNMDIEPDDISISDSVSVTWAIK